MRRRSNEQLGAFLLIEVTVVTKVKSADDFGKGDDTKSKMIGMTDKAEHNGCNFWWKQEEGTTERLMIVDDGGRRI